MINDVLLIAGAVSVAGWGIAHLFPTMSVVKGFGEISTDNRRIIIMEWINEGFTLIFIGMLVLIVTLFGGKVGTIHKMVYISSSVMLFGMAILSLFTGAKIKFIPFRLCPVIFSASAVLFLLGTLI